MSWSTQGSVKRSRYSVLVNPRQCQEGNEGGSVPWTTQDSDGGGGRGRSIDGINMIVDRVMWQWKKHHVTYDYLMIPRAVQFLHCPLLWVVQALGRSMTSNHLCRPTAMGCPGTWVHHQSSSPLHLAPLPWVVQALTKSTCIQAQLLLGLHVFIVVPSQEFVGILCLEIQ